MIYILLGYDQSTYQAPSAANKTNNIGNDIGTKKYTYTSDGLHQ